MKINKQFVTTRYVENEFLTRPPGTHLKGSSLTPQTRYVENEFLTSPPGTHLKGSSLTPRTRYVENEFLTRPPGTMDTPQLFHVGRRI